MVLKAEVTQFICRHFFQATYCLNSLHQQVRAAHMLAEKQNSEAKQV